MRQEAHTARARGRVYQAHGQWAQQAAAALAQCQAELRAQDAGWHGLGVATSPVVPMGVRFSQSPDYAACLAAFGRVTSLVQGSGLGADALEAIERMGLLHASALYERWCLVKIIAVLMEDFQFQPQRGWQDRLVQAVTGKPQA